MDQCCIVRTANRKRLPASSLGCAVALLGAALLPSTARAAPGDMNCDGVVNAADIPLFVQGLLATGGFTGCDISRADTNTDAVINGLDAQAFVAALLMNSCPGILCGGNCVDSDSDLFNCGSCGQMCGPGEECYGGECHPAAPCPDCGGP